jgi:plasmid maintenance system killer protein
VLLAFDDPDLQRFYADDVPIPGLAGPAAEHCLDALALLVAARSLRDLASLRAYQFLTREVRGTWLSLRLNEGFALAVSVHGDGTDAATATIKIARVRKLQRST